MKNTLEKNLTHTLVWIARKDMEPWYDSPKGAPKGHSSMRNTARRVQRKLQRVHESLAHQKQIQVARGNADRQTWNFRYYPEKARIVLHTSYHYDFLKYGDSVMTEANAKSLKSISNFLFTGASYFLPARDFEAMLDAYLHRKKEI